MNQTDVSKVKTELEKLLDKKFAEIERRLSEIERRQGTTVDFAPDGVRKISVETVGVSTDPDEHYVHID